MIEQVLKAKFLGALIGTGVGDALGAPFEGRRKVNLEEIEEVAETRKVLTYTDDTHVALAINAQPNREVDQEAFIVKLYDFAQHRLYRQKIASIKDLLGEQDRAEVISILGNGVEALRSVPTAIYSFLKQPKSYTDAVVYAISLGGDTDTIAGMTGAISGAYLGVEAIPDRWKGKLENRPYIEAVAEKLWQLAAS